MSTAILQPLTALLSAVRAYRGAFLFHRNRVSCEIKKGTDSRTCTLNILMHSNRDSLCSQVLVLFIDRMVRMNCLIQGIQSSISRFFQNSKQRLHKTQSLSPEFLISLMAVLSLT